MFLVLLAACSSDDAGSQLPGHGPAPARQPEMPPIRVPGLHAHDAVIDLPAVLEESVHPDLMAAALEDAGFVGGTERTLTGRLGVFSRVVVRGWAFSSEDGAGSFAEWVRVYAGDLIGQAEQLHVDVPGGVAMLLHSPTGCCHEATPIYLAVWQRGATAWTIRASGARIHTAPVVALVRSVEKET